jgi:hypothetical protein
MFEILWLFVTATQRALALETMWCDAGAAAERRYAESTVPFVISEPPLDAAMMDGDVVVVSDVGGERKVLRSSPGGGTEVLLPETRKLVPGGELLFASGLDWWYGLAGTRQGAKGLYFVSGNGASGVVPLSRPSAHRWLMLKSGALRALELSTSGEGVPVATEVHAAGPVRSWHLPFDLGRLTSAEILPDGRVAVVTHHDRSARLTLLLLDDDDRIEIIQLGYKMMIQLATAIDSAGHLAIATATTDHRVDGTVIDPTHAEEPKWQSVRRGVRLGGWNGDIQTVPVSEGFVIAWVNRSESPPRLEAANLSAGGAFMIIGALLDRDRDTFFSLRTEDNEPVFIWDDGRRVVMRRLPASIGGYQLIELLTSRYCR